MLTTTLPILQDGQNQASLATYILDGDRIRPAVVICPGGGYQFLSPREGEAIALQFAAAGFHTFILSYTVKPKYYRQPLLELSQAVNEVRGRAREWKINPEQIAVCGFSAGGHLAASLGVHWDKLLDSPENKPNALILSYPVITSGAFTHGGSMLHLLGPEPTEDLLAEMSLETQVSPGTPPTFLWHTVADQAVPVENSLFFAGALRKQNVPFELHIYPNGPHGLSLATVETDDSRGTDTHVATWMGLCVEWLKGLFQVK